MLENLFKAEKKSEKELHLIELKTLKKAITWLADAELSKTELKFLKYCLFYSDDELMFEINQADLSHVLKMQQSNISRTVKSLIRKGILLNVVNNTYSIYHVPATTFYRKNKN